MTDAQFKLAELLEQWADTARFDTGPGRSFEDAEALAKFIAADLVEQFVSK